MSFKVNKARDDARVLDPDAASPDRRIPDVAACRAGANTARARLIGLSGIQGGHSVANLLAFTRATKLDRTFLQAAIGIRTPGTLLGVTRPDQSYARMVSASGDNSKLKTVAKFGSRAVAESQPSAALNASTARGSVGSLWNLGSLEESTRRWQSIYGDALENTAIKQVAAKDRCIAGQYSGNTIQIKRTLDVQSANIGTQVVQSFLRGYEPQLTASLNAFNPPLFDSIEKFAFGFVGLARRMGALFEVWRPKLDGAFDWLRREMEQWPRDPYGELVPAWNVRLYRLAQAAYEGDYVARARFLSEIEADGSPDNVLVISELLKPTFHPERLDRRVDWEQMHPAGARRWLSRRLDGLKLGAWKEEQERKNSERLYELEWQVVEAMSSDMSELEFVEFELREDERALYKQLRGVLPEQQYWFCWYRARGLKYEEIAAKMGVGLSTVKTHARLVKRNPGLLEVLDR